MLNHIPETGYVESKFTDATIVCINGKDEQESISIWNAQGPDIAKVYCQHYPHSIGLWYTAMAERVGNQDITKLAEQGDPNRLFLEIINDFVATTGCGYEPDTKIKLDLRRGCKWWHPELYTQEDLQDIAAATQQVYIYVLQNLVAWSRQNLPSDNLVLETSCPLGDSDAINLYSFYSQVYITC